MSYAVLAFLLLSGCAGPGRRGAPPSLLVTGRSVAGHPGADAVLIKEGRVAAVGRAAELQADSRLETGGEITPGFHDAHLHLLDGGLSLRQVILDEARSVEEAVRLIGLHPGRTGTVRGRGWSYNIVSSGTYPARHALDAVTRERPVIMESFDGHAYWLNTRALENAGVLRPGNDPEGATVVREPDGTAQGTVLEVGAEFLERAGGRLSRAEKLRGVRDGLARLAAAGVTSAVVMSGDLEEFDVLEYLERRGELTLRVFYCPPLEGDLDVYEDLRRRSRGRLQFGWLKGFVDGVIETKTAYMLEPYAGTAERGTPAIAPDELVALVSSAQARGFSVALHAVGDAGVRLALDAYAAADRAAPRPVRRRRVEHLEVVDPADLPRFKDLDVVASMQPLHAAPAAPDDGAWARNLGPERRARAFPWRALLDAGAVLAFGSDWPVVSPEALEGLSVAATRLTPAEALRGYTEGPAYAAGMPELGCLEPGCLADVVVLVPEPDPAHPESFKKSGAMHVIVDGRQVTSPAASPRVSSPR